MKKLGLSKSRPISEDFEVCQTKVIKVMEICE